MISETMFANRASSFWRASTPMSEPFVRLINSRLSIIRGAPLISLTSAERRGLINETAFETFTLIHSTDNVFPQIGASIDHATIETAYESASRYVLGNVEPHPTQPISADEAEEVRELVSRLEARFWQELNDQRLLFKPHFKGCGILKSCSGDLRTDNCIFEIKAGDRPFRSADLRQILLYCALCLKQGDTIFEDVELYNPRLNIQFSCSLEMLSFEISGKSAGNLLFEIIEAISSSGNSI